MARSRLSITIFLVVTLTSCAHRFTTHKFDEKEWTPLGPGVEGVIYYEPHFVEITHSFTALIDPKDGRVVGTSDKGTCLETVQKQEIQILPDLANPRIVINRPTEFSSGKLGVSLANGMLTGVNSESVSRAPELVTATAGAVEKVVGVLEGAACNAAPRIPGFAPYAP
jgi:hypothetical protein